MFKLTFLSADKPLTKTYIFHPNGTIESQPYPLSSAFTSHEVNISTIEDLYAQIIAHGNYGRCLLKGNLEKPIVRESRAGLTTQEASFLLVLDFDGLDSKNKSIDDILAELGLGDVDYIIQYSSSQGIKSGLNAHVFLFLEYAKTPQEIKQWVKWKNLSISLFREQLQLTKSCMSLHWGIDITVNQPDKLLYIAPPVISGAEDPVKNRIQLVKKEKRTSDISRAPVSIDQETINVIKQLRSAAGLPEHNLTIKYIKRDKMYVLPNPDKASVTGIKRNADFTYLNLNGGDSWAYWHLTAHPNFLFNFKGEPTYKLEDIVPEYFSQAIDFARKYRQEAHKPKEKSERIQHFIINHKPEGKYYKVTYDPNIGVSLDPAPTAKHIEDFCILNKVLIPENIDDWVICFDPTADYVINSNEKIINLYRPTKYKFISADDSEIPQLYYDLIHHVCGNDNDATYRFINWLSYIWQTGKKPKTAWVLHGTYGTGKGRLLTILQKLFGEHCVVVSPENINEHFNAMIEFAQILWIDEVTTDAWDNDRITPKLRSWITEDVVPIRGMRKNAEDKPSFMGIIVAANEHNPVEIRADDRRWSVAPRQETKISNLPWATSNIIDNDGWLYEEENLISLAAALASFKVDVALARTPLENEAKKTVQQTTQKLPEDIVKALQQGNASYFLEYLPTSQAIPTVEGGLYKQVVEKMMRGGKVPLSTQDIMKLFSFLVGWAQAPGKFSKAVSKFGLPLAGKTARDGQRTFAGTYFEFNITEHDRYMWAQAQENADLRVVRHAEA